MTREYVVYEGPEFTIEWYHSETGKSNALKYFNGLDRERKLAAFELFMTMANIGRILNITKFRHEGEGIYAFKPKPDRFLCFFFADRKIIITNGFEKKQDKMPLIELKKATIAQRGYKFRVEQRTYYE